MHHRQGYVCRMAVRKSSIATPHITKLQQSNPIQIQEYREKMVENILRRRVRRINVPFFSTYFCASQSLCLSVHDIITWTITSPGWQIVSLYLVAQELKTFWASWPLYILNFSFYYSFNSIFRKSEFDTLYKYSISYRFHCLI